MTVQAPERLADALKPWAHLLGGARFIGRHEHPPEDGDDGSRWYVDRQRGGTKLQSITFTIESTQWAPWIAPWAGGIAAELAVEYAALLMDMAADDPKAAVKWLKEEARRQRDLAGEVGTWHHDVLEALLLDHALPDPPPWILGRVLKTGGEVIPITQETLDGWADGILAFISDFRIEPVMVEATIAHPLKRYAGRADLMAHLPGHGLTAVDLKSGRVRKSVIAQLAATVNATEVWLPGGARIPMPKCSSGAVLHLRPRWRRGYKLRPIGPEDLAVGWRWFQRANEALISREKASDIDDLVMYPPTFGPGGQVIGIPKMPMVEDLGIRSAKALAAAGLEWLVDLADFTAGDLREVRGVGPKAVDDIRRVLGEHGLTLADDAKGAAA